jgi:hypothetical protein
MAEPAWHYDAYSKIWDIMAEDQQLEARLKFLETKVGDTLLNSGLGFSCGPWLSRWVVLCCAALDKVPWLSNVQLRRAPRNCAYLQHANWLGEVALPEAFQLTCDAACKGSKCLYRPVHV